MYKPSIADLLVLQVICQDTEQVSINSVGYQVSAVTTGGATAQEVVTAWGAAVSGPVAALLNNNAVYRGAGIRDLTMLPKQAEFYYNAASVPGTAGAVALPRQTAGLISVYDGLAGRGHRGRFYVPFPSATDNVADGKPTVNYGIRLLALSAVLFAPLVVVGAGGNTTITPGIIHRRANKVPLVSPTFTPTGPPVLRAVWATQRRRGSYGRPNVSPV